MKENLSFSIRKAEQKDVPVILTLVKQLAVYEKLLHEVQATEDLYERFGFTDHSYFETILAETQEGEAIGFALYFFTFSTFIGKPTLYLEDLFVLPEYRGYGIGKGLLVELVKIALAHDCGRMEWAVLNWNTPAIEFYKSLGALPMSGWTTFRLTREVMEDIASQ